MFKSVFIKYVTAFLLINISCMIILTAIITSLINSYNADVRSTTLHRAAEYVSEYATEQIKIADHNSISDYVSLHPETVHSFLEIMGINIDNLILLVSDEKGAVILSGGSDEAMSVTKKACNFADGNSHIYISDDLLTSLMSGDKIEEVSDLNGIFSESYDIHSVPMLSSDGAYLGAVHACSVTSGLNILLNRTVKTIFMSTIWIMLAMLVVVYFISERLVSPIKAMSRAAKMFAKGQFDVRIPVYGDDEVAELATAFNNMASSLSTNEEMRRVFLANVSHDLRTPMTTISGFIDGILDGAIPPEKHEYYLGVIASEVRRLSRLVSSLLDISKIQAGERKFTKISFDICEMCRQVLISSEQRIEEKNLDVEFICDRDNMYVIGDTDAIHQIVYNLFDNAIKFASVGGKYIIEIKEVGQKIETSVYNEGIGIPEEDIPFVFDRFYKGDKSRGLDKTGVGLGLYISRTILEAHNEEITVESEYGKWCRFAFTLSKGTAPKNTILPDTIRNNGGSL